MIVVHFTPIFGMLGIAVTGAPSALFGVPNVRPGERFEDYWVRERSDEAERRDRNEEPWVSGPDSRDRAAP